MGADIPKEAFPLRINGTTVYSPLTLSAEWDTLVRLILMLFASCFGSTVNAYFILAFFQHPDLQRLRHVYLAFVGLADFLITGGAIPTETVVFMSGYEDIVPFCRFAQFLTATSTYCYSIFYAMVAGEVFIRVCLNSKLVTGNRMRKYTIIGSVAILTFVISAALGYVGAYWGLDYDYCERRHFGNLFFRAATFTVVHFCTYFWTMWALLTSSHYIQEYHISKHRFKPILYDLDVTMIKLHLVAYNLFICSWAPYMYILILFPYTRDSIFYGLAWFGIGRSLVTSILYGMTSIVFADAYQHILSYCCCKKKNTRYLKPKHRRRDEETGDAPRVAVSSHAMQHMCSRHCRGHGSPQLAMTSTQDTIDLFIIKH